ncbi:hypothetical protein BGT96224_5215 [Blumeria graminis f. sp. tritici 96224]|nr:hypothetical protein BGT96224_5215 [Blumeria graminis f. sp. tritici 96224]
MPIARSRVVRAISTTGCTACLPFTTNMAGRGVEAATRKSLALGDIFATCYSTIFAIAALVDLKAKKKRTARMGSLDCRGASRAAIS